MHNHNKLICMLFVSFDGIYLTYLVMEVQIVPGSTPYDQTHSDLILFNQTKFVHQEGSTISLLPFTLHLVVSIHVGICMCKTFCNQKNTIICINLHVT